MTDYKDFLVCLYHSKLEWGAIKSEYVPVPWDATIQRDIDALGGFGFFEIEAHVLASKNYFKEKIDFKGIIEVVRKCAIQQGEQRNRNAFTMCVFNKIQLQIQNFR